VRDYFNLEKSEVMYREMMPLCGGDDVNEIARDRVMDAMGWGTSRRYSSPDTCSLINRNPGWIGVP
jgi:hypothetical protein